MAVDSFWSILENLKKVPGLVCDLLVRWRTSTIEKEITEKTRVQVVSERIKGLRLLSKGESASIKKLIIIKLVQHTGRKVFKLI